MHVRGFGVFDSIFLKPSFDDQCVGITANVMPASLLERAGKLSESHPCAYVIYVDGSGIRVMYQDESPHGYRVERLGGEAGMLFSSTRLRQDTVQLLPVRTAVYSLISTG